MGNLGLQIRQLRLNEGPLDLLIEKHVFAQEPFVEQSLEVCKMAIDDAKMLFLLGNLNGHGIKFRLNSRPLFLERLDLTTVSVSEL